MYVLRIDNSVVVCVNELLRTMIVCMIGLTLPLQVILQLIFTKLTNRVFIFRYVHVVDMVIAGCAGVWIWKHREFSSKKNNGFRLSNPPH